jgi:hypothetical protein
MSAFPPPNSGAAPPLAGTPAPLRYDPATGQPVYGFDPATGQPIHTPPAAAAPAMRFDPATGQPIAAQAVTAPFTPPAALHPQGVFPGAPTSTSDVAFGEVAWTGGLPVGQYVVRLEDIEAGTSQSNNDKLQFTAITTQPSADIAAGTKAVWSYSLTERAIGKLGRDVVRAGINGTVRYPKDARGMAAALLQELRGVQVVLRVEEQKNGDGVNTSIVSRYGGGATAAPAQVQPTPPPAPTPVAAAAPLGISFPTAAPAGTGGFSQV